MLIVPSYLTILQQHCAIIFFYLRLFVFAGLVVCISHANERYFLSRSSSLVHVKCYNWPEIHLIKDGAIALRNMNERISGELHLFKVEPRTTSFLVIGVFIYLQGAFKWTGVARRSTSVLDQLVRTRNLGENTRRQ